jgi:1,2-diacylglycerol 3-alpha-glucosyltransferase
MRIAFFSDTFFPDKNGVASAIYHFANLLVHAGHEVMVVAPKPVGWKKEHRKQLDERVRVVFATTLYTTIFSPDGSFGWLTPGQTREVKAFAPDIVHIHTPSTIGWHGILIARSLARPVVLHMHTNYYHPDTWRVIGVKNAWLVRLGLAFAWLVTRFYASRAKGLITPTKAFGDVLAQHLTQPIHTVSYPLEKEWYVTQKELDRPLSNQLLYVGRLGKEKRIDLALRAFARASASLPELRFRIVGDGLAKRSLESLTNELGIADKVVFSGGIPRKQILSEGLYQQADWFLSMSIFETLGYTLIESMAQGTPVLARSCPVNNEVVRGGGKIFKHESEEEMIIAVAEFLAESYRKDTLPEWRVHARKAAEKFSEGSITQDLVATYERVLQGVA